MPRPTRLLLLSLMFGLPLLPPPAAAARPAGKVVGELGPSDERGMTRLIVELPVAAAPEALLPPKAIRSQRARIELAGDRLLAELPAEAATVVRRYTVVPYLALEVDARGLSDLTGSKRAGRLYPDYQATAALDRSIFLINADDLHRSGVTGSGSAVAVLDTGVDLDHPFLPRPVAEACFASNGRCPNGTTTQIGPGAGAGCVGAAGCFHGTHVAGIALGATSSLVGVAPRANLISVNTFSVIDNDTCPEGERPCARTSEADVVAGLEFVLSQLPFHRVSAVNMSLGGGRFEGPCDRELAPLKAIIDQLRAAGVVVAAASGNDGLKDSLGFPACVSSAVAVGASDDFDQAAEFSNSAYNLDLLAPGVEILSSVPGGDYASYPGTSMATPHVAGTVALLREAFPAVSVTSIESAVIASGPRVVDRANNLAHRRLDALSAAQILLAARNPCTPDAYTLCLADRRFRVQVLWRNQFSGASGRAGALPKASSAGFFYFTDPNNIELLVKILDFGSVFKVFYGQLTNLEYEILISDTATGEVKLYRSEPAACGSFDDSAFKHSALQTVELGPVSSSSAATGCRPSADTLCLLNNRIAVRLDWRNQFNGDTGFGRPGTLSSLAGYFFFTDPGNIELLVKALDFGDRTLVFFGALSNLEYTLHVTDTTSGQTKTYFNSGGNYCGGQDNAAFGGGTPPATVITEREANDATATAQPIAGARPLLVRGTAESFDVGSLAVTIGGTRDDIEDLYRLRTTALGLTAVLSGLLVDADLWLFDARGQALAASTIAGLTPESLDLPTLPAGEYLIGVSYWDANGFGSTRYELLVNGGD